MPPGADTRAAGAAATETTARSSLGRSYWLYALLIFFSFAGSIGHVIAMTWLLLRGPDGSSYVALAFMLSAVPSIALYRLVRSRPVRNLTTSLARLDLAQAALALVIPLLAFAGMRPSRALLLCQELLLSCCGAFVFAQSRLLLVRVVPSEAMLAANSVSAAVFQAGNSAGAVQGGLLVAAAGPYVAMVVNAATFVVSALGLTFFVRPVRGRSPDGAGSPPGTPVRRHAPAARYPNGAMLITGTVVLLTVQRLFLGSVGPLVDTHLNGDAALQGFLQLAFTLGGVSGGLLIGRYRTRLPPRTSAHAILGTCAAAFVTLCAVSLIPLVLAACFAIGVTVSFWSVFQSQAQDAGDDRREADVLARIGLGQSLAAITIFAAASALALLAQPRFVMAALGLLLVCLGMAAARGLADTRSRAEAGSTAP